MYAPFVFFHLALFFYCRHAVHVHIGWVQLTILERASSTCLLQTALQTATRREHHTGGLARVNGA